MHSGFLNLYKPMGITAHDCVSRVRKLFKQKRVGHSGTLDPAATGVLPIALGQATRLLRFLPEGKAYRATVRFGIVTTTDDMEGEAIATQPFPPINLAEVEALLPLFQGKIQQRPPMFSAIHVEGERLYNLARAGKVVDVPMRTVEVKSIEVLAWREGEYPELELDIQCGTGTYIRAIARDLGEKLGCGGTLSGLERTFSNGFDLSSSLSFEQISEALGQDRFTVLAPDLGLQHLKAVYLETEQAKRWCQGQAIAFEPTGSVIPEDLAEDKEDSDKKIDGNSLGSPDRETTTYMRVYNQENQFLGMTELRQGASQTLHPCVVFGE
ncbi:tRNA pseudouridine(55) synthase TruB [Tumidithrix elongata RA019]|uniref:tRNA pseudouridine synthase B n=1 Tax=Tumidithrix elongata BACA0141 TaxID=2716417 RepID=A0AAW9PXX8_9CYAN|nr:tRNA pseudouridine(55) synthase TruB [Tumidithrix elongata RA019]